MLHSSIMRAARVDQQKDQEQQEDLQAMVAQAGYDDDEDDGILFPEEEEEELAQRQHQQQPQHPAVQQHLFLDHPAEMNKGLDSMTYSSPTFSEQQEEEEEQQEEEEEEEEGRGLKEEAAEADMMTTTIHDEKDDAYQKGEEYNDEQFYTPCWSSMRSRGGGHNTGATPMSAASSSVKKQLFASRKATPMPSPSYTIHEEEENDDDDDNNNAMDEINVNDELEGDDVNPSTPGPAFRRPPCTPYPAAESSSKLPIHFPSDPVELQQVISQMAIDLKAAESEKQHLLLQVRALQGEETRLLQQVQQLAASEKALEDHVLFLRQETAQAKDDVSSTRTLEVLRGDMLEAAHKEIAELTQELTETKYCLKKATEERDMRKNDAQRTVRALKEEITRLAEELAKKTVLSSAQKRTGRDWEARAEAEAARADQLHQAVQSLQDELAHAQDRIRDEERRRQEAEETAEYEKGRVVDMGDRLRQTQGQLLSVQAQLRAITADLEAERRAHGGKEIAQHYMAEMDRISHNFEEERRDWEEEVQALKFQLEEARHKAAAAAAATPRKATGENPLFSPYDIEKGLGRPQPPLPTPSAASMTLPHQQEEEREEGTVEAEDGEDVEEAEPAHDLSEFIEEAVNGDLDVGREEEVAYWQEKALAAEEECAGLRQALVATFQDNDNNSNDKEWTTGREEWQQQQQQESSGIDDNAMISSAKSSLQDDLEREVEKVASLEQQIREDEAYRLAQVKKAHELARHLASGQVDLTEQDEDGLLLLPGTLHDNEDEGSYPPGVLDVLEGVRRWAVLMKARAYEDVKAEVQELEEWRRDHRSRHQNSNPKTAVDAQVQTDGESEYASHLQQCQISVLQNELEGKTAEAQRWQVRVKTVEGRVQELEQQVAEEKRRVLAVKEASQAEYEKDKAVYLAGLMLEREEEKLAMMNEQRRQEEEKQKQQHEQQRDHLTTDEAARLIGRAVSEAREEWEAEESKRLHSIYATFAEEKERLIDQTENEWSGRLEEIGKKVKQLQGVLSKLSAKAREKDALATQALGQLKAQQQQEAELKGLLERYKRAAAAKNVKVKELEKLCEQTKREAQAVLLTAAAESSRSAAATTSLELKELEKRLKADHEKEIDVVMNALRTRYKRRMAHMEKKWESERESLLLAAALRSPPPAPPANRSSSGSAVLAHAASVSSRYRPGAAAGHRN